MLEAAMGAVIADVEAARNLPPPVMMVASLPVYSINWTPPATLNYIMGGCVVVAGSKLPTRLCTLGNVACSNSAAAEDSTCQR